LENGLGNSNDVPTFIAETVEGASRAQGVRAKQKPKEDIVKPLLRRGDALKVTGKEYIKNLYQVHGASRYEILSNSRSQREGQEKGKKPSFFGLYQGEQRTGKKGGERDPRPPACEGKSSPESDRSSFWRAHI